MGNQCCGPRTEPEPLVSETQIKKPGCNVQTGKILNSPMSKACVIHPRKKKSINSKPNATSVQSSSSIKSPTMNSRRIVKALYEYKARADSDISFRKGDRMEVLSDAEPDWWRVLHLTSNTEGYVPADYVATENSVECEDWYFPDISRKEAEHLLMEERHPKGTFLVRPAEHGSHDYSLSFKAWKEDRGFTIKHFRINSYGGGTYGVSEKHTYPSLSEFVVSYTKSASCFRNLIARPCTKPEPQMWDLGPEQRDQWEIPRTEIQLIKLLGHGNYGNVYYGKWRHNIEVAVKTLKQNTMSKEAFLQEAAIMKTLRHRSLIALYAVCSTQEPVYIVQEYMSKGSLLEFLRNDEGKRLQYEDLVYIAGQVVSGMAYLESKMLIHRDLAARNVLVGDNNVAKICDFGLARIIVDDEYRLTSANSKFPFKWTAPEAITHGKFSIKSDVWSFGVFLMELFTRGQTPYPGVRSKDILSLIETGYRMPKPSKYYVPDHLYKIMRRCWDEVPANRPTFDYLNQYFGFKESADL